MFQFRRRERERGEEEHFEGKPVLLESMIVLIIFGGRSRQPQPQRRKRERLYYHYHWDPTILIGTEEGRSIFPFSLAGGRKMHQERGDFLSSETPIERGRLSGAKKEATGYSLFKDYWGKSITAK